MVDVYVEVDTSEGTLGLDEIANGPGELRQAVQQRDLHGQLNVDLSEDDGLVLVDDLGALVGQVCLQSITALASGQAVTIEGASAPEKTRLEPDGDIIAITLPAGEQLVFPKQALLEALVGCGESFLNFQREHRGEAGAAYADAYAELLQGARAALG